MTITSLAKGPNYKRISITAVDASSTNSSETVQVSDMSEVTFQVVWASHDDTSTFAIQSSQNGGSNWDTISGTSTTTSGASGSATIVVTTMPGGLARITVTEADGNAGATLTPYITMRRRS